MKQHITPQQLNELSKKGKRKLFKWWRENDKEENEDTVLVYYKTKEHEGKVGLHYHQALEHIYFEDDTYNSLPLLSIGQMIEFLTTEENGERKLHYTKEPLRRTSNGKSIDINGSWWWTNQYQSTRFSLSYTELCDALWEAVKEVLEKE